MPAIEQKFAEQQDALTEALARYDIDVGQIADLFSPSAVAGIIGSIAEWLAGGLTFSFFLLFIVLYMLLDSYDVSARLERHLRPAAFERLSRYQRSIRRYWVITTFTGFVAAALDFALLVVLGVPFALFLAVLAFVTNYIPNVGYFIALVPAAFFAWIEQGWTGVVVVFIGYWLFNTLAGSVIAPRLNATQLNINFTTSLVAVLFWGWVLGPIGGLISVPLTLLVRDLVLADRPGTLWLADLLSRDGGDEGRGRRGRRRRGGGSVAADGGDAEPDGGDAAADGRDAAAEGGDGSVAGAAAPETKT
jgi:predicted PurR-regulated permease PerM